jgi:hypothetical protein
LDAAFFYVYIVSCSVVVRWHPQVYIIAPQAAGFRACGWRLLVFWGKSSRWYEPCGRIDAGHTVPVHTGPQHGHAECDPMEYAVEFLHRGRA